MRQEEIDTHIEMRKTYARMTQDLVAIRQYAKSCAGQPDAMQKLVDVSYFAEKTRQLADMIRKDCQELRDLCDRMVCVLWAQQDSGEPIRTEYCTASPDVKMQASLPDRKKQPIEYAAFCDYMGIPRELYCAPDGESPPVQVHWAGMLSYFSALLSQGKPLPPGIDPTKMYPVYKVRLQPRKEISGDLGIA